MNSCHPLAMATELILMKLLVDNCNREMEFLGDHPVQGPWGLFRDLLSPQEVLRAQHAQGKLLLGSILVNATSRQIGVFRLKYCPSLYASNDRNA